LIVQHPAFLGAGIQWADLNLAGLAQKITGKPHHDRRFIRP